MSESKERVGSGFSSLEHSECLSLARCFSFIFLLFELPEYLLASFKAGSFAGSIFVCLPFDSGTQTAAKGTNEDDPDKMDIELRVCGYINIFSF